MKTDYSKTQLDTSVQYVLEHIEQHGKTVQIQTVQYEFTALTDFKRRGSFRYIKREGLKGGFLRYFDDHKELVSQAYFEADTEVIEMIARWVLALGDRIYVGHPVEKPLERSINKQFTDLLQRIRSGKKGLPLFSLPSEWPEGLTPQN